MAAPQNFRAAFHGFNREDVVRYLEYLNHKHQGQTAQLNTQLEALQAQLREKEEQLRTQQDLIASLQAECAALNTQLEAAAVEPAPQEPQEAAPGPREELEAYRRAERIEREAKERAELVYFQASTVLSEATAKVDGISGDITDMADQVMRQLTQLQVAVGGSKQALQEAASVMNAIRPNQ